MSITSLFGRAEQDLDLLVEKSREIAKLLLGPNYTAKVHIYYLNLQVNQFQILRQPLPNKTNGDNSKALRRTKDLPSK